MQELTLIASLDSYLNTSHLTGYTLGWGSLALINAALARIDRRSPLLYFIGSLFLGPIITLLIAGTREGDKGRLSQVDLLRRDSPTQ